MFPRLYVIKTPNIYYIWLYKDQYDIPNIADNY